MIIGAPMARRGKGRRHSRGIFFQVLFEASSRGVDRIQLLGLRAEAAGVLGEELDYIQQLCQVVCDRMNRMDARIATAAPQWPVNQLSKIDLSILHLAIAELTLELTPVAVVIDEAVRLAKLYRGENAGAFVNGVLGTIVRAMQSSTGLSEA